jgi:glycine/D-amino acid oxidase-like deaminating enzyme
MSPNAPDRCAINTVVRGNGQCGAAYGRRMAPRVAIIGAGMSGLCMAIKLQAAGIESYTVFEQAADVGGTWRDNTYPGLHCDVPSRYYSYSFRPNSEWSKFQSPGPEIQRYLRTCADEHSIGSHIRFLARTPVAQYSRTRFVRGQGVSLVAMGSFNTVAGQTHWIDRNRVYRRSDHCGARRKCSRAYRLPAQRAMDLSVAKLPL